MHKNYLRVWRLTEEWMAKFVYSVQCTIWVEWISQLAELASQHLMDISFWNASESKIIRLNQPLKLFVCQTCCHWLWLGSSRHLLLSLHPAHHGGAGAHSGRGSRWRGPPVRLAVPRGPVLRHWLQTCQPLVWSQIRAGLAGRLRFHQNGFKLCSNLVDTKGLI